MIMDGNGRWAAQHGKNRAAGHQAGTENVRRVVRAFDDHGVRFVTLYAFSTENWRRPRTEIRSLLSILGSSIDRELDGMHKDNVRILHIGKLDRVSRLLGRKIISAVDRTEDNTGLTLVLAFDYGGREEILEATRRMIRAGVNPDKVDEELFSSYLYRPDLPSPDLIVRTGGEMRLSNFLLWESAYSEYYSTSAYWPDFDGAEVEKALAAYNQRQRRYGAVTPLPAGLSEPA